MSHPIKSATLVALCSFVAPALLQAADPKPQVPAATTSQPAAAAPAAKPAEAAVPAKRTTPVTISGKGDARAPGYIILFENNINANTEVERLQKLYGFKATHVYSSMPTFQGFAGKIPSETIEKLRWEGSIKTIERDGMATTNGGGAMTAQ